MNSPLPGRSGTENVTSRTTVRSPNRFVTHSIEEAIYLGDRVYVFSSAPGTILREMVVPPPDRPPKEMLRDPAFVERVCEVRDLMDTLAASMRAGD